MKRHLIGLVTIAAVLAAGGGYVAWAAWRQQPAHGSGVFEPSRPGTVLYVDEAAGDRRLGQAPIAAPGSAAVSGELRCLRTYSAGGTTVCLRPLVVPAGFEAAVLSGTTINTRIRLGGTPSRARVSPSGRLVAWTVFRTGDSYADEGTFSTTTGIYDTVRKTRYDSLEDFTLTIGGGAYRRPDVNYWGVTFAADDRTFYATVSSAGRTWLVRGDLVTRTLMAIRENVECPSLSPDGRRVAYKKKEAAGRWRLHVWDMTDGREWPLAETENVDDQAIWFDDKTIGYATIPVGGQRPAVFAVPADGSGSPVLWRADASSPAPVR